MLQIKDIHKVYKTGDLVQTALNGVSLNLRDNEFVAILGPSGSGKTTLLNIIGGLDRYDSGDLIINNISTKKYKDRDWDSYRNHTIGFVFQSYNLIPHQTVLSNVELALTISGVKGKERKQRALKALEEVGLKEQAHKKPNQMSGGQMQRVAIARALVNNPDILLADEPTGALDTKTSIQVMELLKKVAKDRLVVMVTHNPELAEQYANRIVRLQDGQIISDSNPFNPQHVETKPVSKNMGKAHMGFFTALSLSFNNLLTKKGRTFLTAFAGSIGIIGIALILALSTGFQNYIDKIQEDTMSSYPLTIQKETANVFGALLSMSADSGDTTTDSNTVQEQMLISSMMNSVGTNDLKTFKSWLENNEDLYAEDVTNITYSYSVSPRIYTIDETGEYAQLNPNTLMSSIYSDSASSLLSSISSSSSMGTFSEYDMEDVKKDTQLLAGRYPEKYNEVIIVLSDPGQISDLLVYSLGLRDTSELKTLISQVMGGDQVTIENDPRTYTYEDLMNVQLKLINTSDLYKYNSQYGTYEDMSDDDDYMKKVYDSSEDLVITGVAYSTSDTSSIAGVIYTPDLVQHVIDLASESEIVKKQLANKDVDVFSGNKFDDDSDDSGLDFNDMVSIDEDKLKDAFKVNISEDDFDFNTLSDSEMTAVILSAANAAEEKAKDPANNAELMSTAVTSTTGIYTAVLQKYINTYEKDNLSVDGATLTINNDKINEIKDTITKDDVKLKIKSLGADSMYTDEDFENIADDIKNAYSSYFNSVSEKAEDILGNKIVSYTAATMNYQGQDISYVIYTKPSTAATATPDYVASTTLLQNVASNFVHLTSAATSFYKISCISSAIGTATGTIMTPITKSLTNLGDLFSGDIMTIDTDAFAEAFNFDMDEDELTRLMESMLTSSSASYSNNLTELGYQDVNDPTSISIYFNSFDSKENFLDVLENYNDTVDEEQEIEYTDITGILMSSVEVIINSVTYVLIAFVSISLIVSSIMIAVITLISVMERTKEIGILRAMGASKHNVSSIFNAETFIIGLLSGGIGVGFSLAVIPLINKLIYHLTDNPDINAVLPANAAIILVIIAVVLTLVAGLIPSRKAAKQDPVIALRSE